MKMNIYFKGLVVSLLLIVGMFTSCEDQPDKFELTGGLPQVSYIRMPLVSGKKLRVIKKASFDDTLITWPNQLLCPLKETV